MPRRQFWEIIKDDDAKTFEVLRLSFDDTGMNNLTCEMQDLGMHVRGETIPSTIPREQIPQSYRHIQYTPEDGLYLRLKTEYEQRKIRKNLDE